jgi:hypothetical protein
MSRTLTPLALAVAQAKRLGQRQAARGDVRSDQAMDQLAPFIKETAQRIHGRYYSLRRQLASDFVSHAPAMVWTRIEHFEDWYNQELPPAVRAEEAKDFFAAWCYRELHFRYLDAGRGQRAEPKVKALEFAGSDLADDRSGLNEPSVYDFDLSPADVARLREEWDPLDAVILFSLGGQWSQVPADLWAHWLTELSLKPPFPPPEFEAAAKVKRRAVLADALGVSRDVIFQRWHRLKAKYLS